MKHTQRPIGRSLLLTAAIMLGCDPSSSSGPTNDHPRGDEKVDLGDGGDDGKNECPDCTDGHADDGGGGEECPRTQGYWKNHDWPAHTTELLCDQLWLDILWTPPAGGDAWYILAHQWIAASLNVAAGVETSAEIDAALLAAEALLLTCEADTSDRDEAIELAALLDAFNNGPCEGEDDGDHDDDDDHDDDGKDDDGHDCPDTTSGGDDGKD